MCIFGNREFRALIKELDTPKKISGYMLKNFSYRYQAYGVKTPLKLFLEKVGDCNDFSGFATYIANIHGYPSWEIRMMYVGRPINHWISVFEEEKGNLTYIDNMTYYSNNYADFREIVIANCQIRNRVLEKYEVYDKNMKIIEVGDAK